MDIFGQTAQDHYVDYTSKTSRNLYSPRKRKTKQDTEPPES